MQLIHVHSINTVSNQTKRQNIVGKTNYKKDIKIFVNKTLKLIDLNIVKDNKNKKMEAKNILPPANKIKSKLLRTIL